MAYDVRYTTHARAWVANMLASKYAAHIINVTLEEDTDNGKFVSIGDHIKMDNYKVKQYEGTGFKAEIEEMTSDDLWYVRIYNPGDSFMIYSTPIIEDESNYEIQKEEHFYNAEGDVVRAYQVSAYDRIALSEECFDGTPEEGKSVTIDAATGKLKVA